MGSNDLVSFTECNFEVENKNTPSRNFLPIILLSTASQKLNLRLLKAVYVSHVFLTSLAEKVLLLNTMKALRKFYKFRSIVKNNSSYKGL